MTLLRSLQRVSPAYLATGSRFRVVVASAPAGAVLDTVSALDSMARSCADLHPVRSPPAAFTGTPISIDGARYFVIVALAGSSAPNSCGDYWNWQPIAAWRALSFGGGNNPEAQSPRALRLFVDGVAVEPMRAVTRPAFELRDSVWSRQGVQVRYYYPMDVLALNENGAPRHLRVQVWGDGGAPWTLELPGDAVAQGRLDYMAWRIATVPDAGGALVLQPAHRISDAVTGMLRKASGGDLRGASLRATALLVDASDPRVSDDDRDVARLLVAEALLRRGEAPLATNLVTNLHQRRSCLEPPRGASPALGTLVSSIRGAPCVERDAKRVLGLGLLVPGGGHFASGKHALGGVVAAALAGVMVSALSLDATARSKYADYRASQDYLAAPRLFEEASAVRASARARLTLGVVLWALDAVVATLQVRAENGRLVYGRL